VSGIAFPSGYTEVDALLGAHGGGVVRECQNSSSDLSKGGQSPSTKLPMCISDRASFYGRGGTDKRKNLARKLRVLDDV